MGARGMRCLEKLDNVRVSWNTSWIGLLHYSCVINSPNVKGTFPALGLWSVKETRNSLLRLSRGVKQALGQAAPGQEGRGEPRWGGGGWLCSHSSHFTLQAVHGGLLPAPKFNTSLLVLTLPHSQAGASVVTAEE